MAPTCSMIPCRSECQALGTSLPCLEHPVHGTPAAMLPWKGVEHLWHALR